MARAQADPERSLPGPQRADLLAPQGSRAGPDRRAGRPLTLTLSSRAQTCLCVWNSTYLCAQVWAPKVLHGCVAALTDISLIRLARRLAGERYVDVAVRKRRRGGVRGYR